MHTSGDKTQENKSRSVANAPSAKPGGAEAVPGLIDDRPAAIQRRALQEMANNSPQVKQLRTLQAMTDQKIPGLHTALPVQRVEITIEDWSKIETSNIDDVEELLKSVEKEETTLLPEEKAALWKEYEKGTYNSNQDLVNLVKALCAKEVAQPGQEEDITRDIAAEDAHAWRAPTGATKEQRLEFLQSVVNKARQIIPIAINRMAERTSEDVSNDASNGGFINRMFLCQWQLVKEFGGLMNKKRGLEVEANYIHPAVVERIMLLVREAAIPLAEAEAAEAAENRKKNPSAEPIMQPDLRMSGLCKDYASLVYGLIKQNDPGNTFKARLSFMKDHVFVEADIDTIPYAIDAWYVGNKADKGKEYGVNLRSEHLARLNDESNNNNPKKTKFKELDTSSSSSSSSSSSGPKEKTERKIERKTAAVSPSETDTGTGTATENQRRMASLENQYTRYRDVYKLWILAEPAFKEKAKTILSNKSPGIYVATGQY